jgi:small subunit ribosomal protein S1
MPGPDVKESFAALFEGTTEARSKRARRLGRGEHVEVRVVEITRDAVFVDVGEKQEAFIERAELLAPDGTLLAKVGGTVSAVVVDTDGERIRLSPVRIRQPAVEGLIEAGDEVVAIPRGSSGPLLVEGARVRGSVTGVERYGLFVQIEGTQRGGRGLVPTAETGAPRGADLRKLFPIGTPVEVKILAIAEDGKIRLSIKAVGEDDERREFSAYAAKQGGDARPGGKAEGGARVRGFGTLGDLLSKRSKG